MDDIKKFLKGNWKKIIPGLVALIAAYVFILWFLEIVTQFKTHSRPMTEQEMRENAPR